MFSFEFIIFLVFFSFVPIIVISFISGRFDVALSLILLSFFIGFEFSGKDDVIDKKKYILNAESKEYIYKVNKKHYFLFYDVIYSTRIGEFLISNDFELKANEMIQVKTFFLKKEFYDPELPNIKYEICSFDPYEKKNLCFPAKKISQ